MFGGRPGSHSLIIAPWGRVLGSIKTGKGYAIAEIELGILENFRKMMPIAPQAKL
ncbi:MAG: hypothetical protein OSB34_15230 [Planktomarina sp.]|nr:hypothetical protein [Planktomarina sp.]